MSFSELLRAERVGRGLTQADLASRANISIPTVRALESGAGTILSLEAILPILGLRWRVTEPGEHMGRVLMERRRARGFSQQALARKIGCSRVTIIALEAEFSGRVATLAAALRLLRIHHPLERSDLAKGRGLVPRKNEAEQDRVMTPPDLAKAIIDHFSHAMEGRVLDPSRGEGAFYNHYPDHLERHWCEISEGRDFLSWSDRVEWVVTNPPWSELRTFTRHAMRVSENIVWLAPLTNLTTKARLRDLQEAGFGIAELLFVDTPKSWPQSGFQIVAAHLKKGYTGHWKVAQLRGGGGAQAS
ncbi:helix-turn-helix transcriptional regulator [Thioclava sp. DLFJ4-1]|uniref:helix-turn-helix transcriptional regulator n=1 Tax=Thioclava sp. DLFJ4-1 TaxID=1915313 RepID=UPI00099798DE|nr:helix-turn-helix transcriptional regulator [Thioclava sp. DLFJ4-1]